MPDLSPALDAAVRAVRGESDLDAVRPALDEDDLARVIACAPEAHRLVRAIAALCGGLPSLLDQTTVADPALHAAMAHLIGTRAGQEALRAWAEVAPAGWGRAHAEALIDAVHAGVCDASAAAALIGPGDRSAALLTRTYGMASAIRRWGQSSPDAPTAWATALSPAERNRLITALLRDGAHVASCLPWLPPDAVRAADVDVPVGDALDAFTAASPTARTQGAAILRRLVARAQPAHLDALTRLACVMETKTVWRRVQTLIQASPEDAWRVVVAAPWDALPDDVGAAILTCADRSPVCAAVAAARGFKRCVDVKYFTAAAFFAALDPAVWDALDADSQRRWRRAMSSVAAYLAVRSLGLRPEFLAWTEIGHTLVRTVQRHARDAATQRAALLPAALRALDPDKAYALLSAMPTLPCHSGVLFCIASGRDDAGAIARVQNALRSPADLALAVTLQRSTRVGVPIRACADGLRRALRGRSWSALGAMMPLLTDAARAALTPDRDALVARLAHPDRRDALRQALDRLASLPPDVAVPTCVALTRLTPWNAADAAAALADTLQAHGDAFLSIMNALADGLRGAWPPPQDDSALACALRALARDDPPTARRLAQAFHTSSWRDALIALLHAPQTHTVAVWQALDNAAQRGVVSVLAAAPPDADPPVIRDLLAVLALPAAHSGDADLRAAGVAALTARPKMTRTIWEQLPSAVQQSLGALPAFADLTTPQEPRAIRRARRR